MNNIKKRLHLHISVNSIEDGIKFYSTQLQSKPTKVKKDYAQWIVDDLSLNFAISTRGYKQGINHLGVQYESNDALNGAQAFFEKNGIIGKEDKNAVCCYKESNKYWVKDPIGLVWENYHSMEDIEMFGEDGMNTVDGCCMPNDKQEASGTFCSNTQNSLSCSNQ